MDRHHQTTQRALAAAVGSSRQDRKARTQLELVLVAAAY
jgi:hypothetical protein